MTAAEAAAKYDNDLTQSQSQYNTLANQVRTYVEQVQSQQQPQGQPTTMSSDPDLWLTDPQKAEQALSRNILGQVQQYGQQAFGQIYQGQASLARANSQNDVRLKETWDKYGKEIDNLMAALPAQQKINKEVWDQAAKLIRSNHVEEIAAEKAKALAASMAHTETGARTLASLPEAQSDAIQRIRNSDYGKSHLDYLSDRQLLEQSAKMGRSIDEYAAMVESTHVISHPKKPGEWVNQGLVKEK